MNLLEFSLRLERIPDDALGLLHDKLVNEVVAMITPSDGKNLGEEQLLQLRRWKKAMYAVGRELKKREKSPPSIDILTP